VYNVPLVLRLAGELDRGRWQAGCLAVHGGAGRAGGAADQAGRGDRYPAGCSGGRVRGPQPIESVFSDNDHPSLSQHAAYVRYEIGAVGTLRGVIAEHASLGNLWNLYRPIYAD
jgi:hypothetical protein